MIEQGLVTLVQGNAGVSAIATAGGGFFAQLPEGQTLPSWSYQGVSDTADYVLKEPMALTARRIQIDCYSEATAAGAIRLARAIDSVLNGYHGILSDPDSTRVQGCFRSNLIDFFDTAARTFRRMLEYEVWFVQQ